MNQHIGRAMPADKPFSRRAVPALRGNLRLPGTQRGVALVVALILLVVITLIGLAAVSGTIMQGKMAANQYDRQLAFQSASAALRVAQANLSSAPIARYCNRGGTTCLPNPFTDSNLANKQIQTVTTTNYQPSTAATGQPQYIVESLGNKWISLTGNTGYNQTANSKQYGAQGKSSTATYYRITARSGDPKKVGDRAVVTLQAIIRQG